MIKIERIASKWRLPTKNGCLEQKKWFDRDQPKVPNEYKNFLKENIDWRCCDYWFRWQKLNVVNGLEMENSISDPK